MNALRQILHFFTSLKLTVVCLCLALGLVFIGTLAQVKWGLYIVQQEYFQSLFVYWQPKGGGWKFPVWPGGYLIGTVLLINLVAAHITRFEFKKKKIGIFTIHAGLILLLVGQLMTEVFQVESFMRIPEGESRNYSESARSSELAIIDVTDEKEEKVVAVPVDYLRHNKEIAHPDLPFKAVVKTYLPNSDPQFHGIGRGTASSGTVGFQLHPPAVKMNDRDIPSALVEVQTDEGAKSFEVSNWLLEPPLVDLLQKRAWFQVSQRILDTGKSQEEALQQVPFGMQLNPKIFETPRFTYKGRQYELAMRPIRYYKPFQMKMLDFTHERYPGTEIPKNFSSRIEINRPETGEKREVLIYMNNPLRYWGETYYQGSFERGDKVSILQVVRNPSRLAPYIACILVGVGLTIQFLYHLIGFIKKGANRETKPQRATGKPAKEPALATTR